jgi:hypothetical protein
MDELEKLEILAACDFSLWRKLERLGVRTAHELITGFSHYKLRLSDAVNFLSKGMGDDKDFEDSIFCYGSMIMDYDSIPFEDLDKNDPHFSFLFEYRDLLTELGQSLRSFILRYGAEGGPGIDGSDWEETNVFFDTLERLSERNYRKEVLKPLGIAYRQGSSLND